MMRVLQKILFACVMTVGFAAVGYAQSDDNKKPPKNPPVINPGKPGPQPTPQPTPPKKPNYALVISDQGAKKYLA